MEEHLKKEEFSPKLLDLINKDRQWLVKREEKRGHGLSDENKLELRLGLPGIDDRESTKISHKIDTDESVLSLRYSSTMKSHHKSSSQEQKQVFPTTWPCSGHQQQQPQMLSPKVSFLQYQTGPSAVARETSQPCCTIMVGLQNAEKKPFSSASSTNNTAVHNSSQKRAAPVPVVGWPPIRSFRKKLGSSSSTKLSPEPQGTKPSQIDNEKPVESSRKSLFVKINMDGVPIGRKVDLNAYDSYENLSSAVDELFRGLLAAQRDFSASGNIEEEKAITGLMDGSGEYTLVYEDREGDRMLVGDIPWHAFVSSVKRLRVLKSSDLPNLNRDAQAQEKATH
ncbi:hypothetical protein Nepgr_005557 [Nepenthes gracilis]|uniref:Auxin-responsive protein n=1 Tax=Nepenthes gracilis TaxID=150966 RepID=A0AAD3XGK4_NEPGR|nr:hypothetical protein Nepgr_005557 [Nepenthes gracilis]